MHEDHKKVLYNGRPSRLTSCFVKGWLAFVLISVLIEQQAVMTFSYDFFEILIIK